MCELKSAIAKLKVDSNTSLVKKCYLLRKAKELKNDSEIAEFEFKKKDDLKKFKKQRYDSEHYCKIKLKRQFDSKIKSHLLKVK